MIQLFQEKYAVVVFDSLDAKSVSLGPWSQDYLVKIEIELVIWLEKVSTKSFFVRKINRVHAGLKVVNPGNSADRFLYRSELKCADGG